MKEGKGESYVVFKGKKFTAPFRCLCCGVEVSINQFCYGRCCAYCDVGRCCRTNGYEKGHGRKDILENAEKMGDELQELVKEKLNKMKNEKNIQSNTG